MAKHDVSDLEQIERSLRTWLIAKLAPKHDVQIANFVFPEATGESNVTLIVQASWLDEMGSRESSKFVVRILPEGEKIFNEYDLALQYQMMSLLAPTKVLVPMLLALEEDTSVIGSTFYVMHHVEGQIPADRPPMHLEGWVATAAPSEREQMWWSGVEAMAELHKLNPADFDVPNGLSHPERGSSAIAQQVAMYEQLVEGPVKAVCEPELIEILAWCRKNMPDDSNLRFCWGDSRPANIIYKDFKVAAVLDWEMATLCNPLLDLAWWIWMDRCLSTALGIPRLEGFPEREETIQRWQDLTGYPVTNLAYYELFAVLRYTIIMERVFVREFAKSGERLPNFWMSLLRELFERVRIGESPE